MGDRIRHMYDYRSNDGSTPLCHNLLTGGAVVRQVITNANCPACLDLYSRDNDVTRIKAEKLVNACNGLGLQARLHWDRSPWCCHVALERTYRDEFDENTPGLFFMLEDSDDYRIGDRLGWVWHGALQIDRETDDERGVNDLGFTIPERNHLGDDEHTVAEKIALFMDMLDVTSLVK